MKRTHAKPDESGNELICASGKDVTEEDLLTSYHVREFMDSKPLELKINTP